MKSGRKKENLEEKVNVKEGNKRTKEKGIKKEEKVRIRAETWKRKKRKCLRRLTQGKGRRKGR